VLTPVQREVTRRTGECDCAGTCQAGSVDAKKR
jgi:hypothetical protein